LQKVNLYWFRRDLRLEDNHGLFQALQSDLPVIPVFIFDSNILDPLDKMDIRVEFIHMQLARLKTSLNEIGSDLIIRQGQPKEIWSSLISEYSIHTVFSNRDYESYAKRRDQEIKDILSWNQIEFKQYKDHVVFEGPDILKADGLPYTVFTPYSRRWKEKLSFSTNEKLSEQIESFPSIELHHSFKKMEAEPMPSLDSIGFEPSCIEFPSKKIERSILIEYGAIRDFPGINGTSRLGVHLRFGTISVREVVREAIRSSEPFLNELIWRDFYSQILYHFPHVENGSFRQEYDRIEWINSPEDFDAWSTGQTGYPLVDAGMRELNTTGFMHNRVRMVTASFLTKHLLIDWRIGEGYFAKKLLDYDLTSNNGGWQWAAGCGTDAAPYFRIFNPEIQMKKFDPKYEYIKKWVPEFGTSNYPHPIVDHKFARERCLRVYKNALRP
jgi:deoxyribodipyrimidine photo-lyase